MSDAYSLGVEAYLIGDSIELNPYDDRDSQHDEWDDGYIQEEIRGKAIMILSDEEKQEAWNEVCSNGGSVFDAIDAIERAVLAKVLQSGFNRDSDEAMGKSISVYSGNVSKQEHDDTHTEKHIKIRSRYRPFESVDEFVDSSGFSIEVKSPNQEPIYMWRLEDDGWIECTKEWFYSEISSGYEKRILYEQPAPQQAAAMQESCKLTKADQIKVGDVISMVIAGRRICTSAKEVLNAGTSREEIIYNRKKNHYFITSMVLDGTSNHKDVFIIPSSSLPEAPKTESKS